MSVASVVAVGILAPDPALDIAVIAVVASLWAAFTLRWERKGVLSGGLPHLSGGGSEMAGRMVILGVILALTTWLAVWRGAGLCGPLGIVCSAGPTMLIRCRRRTRSLASV